ncbi:MAG: sugar phosphate isomerase/epimerase family protein [Desulfitobacteriia bacterium]
MKIAYTVGMPGTKGPMFAYQGDLQEILEKLKAIGYDGIEPFIRDPKIIDLASFHRLLEKTGLEVAAVGTAPIGTEDKLTLTDCSPHIRQAAIQRAKELVDFAAIFGCNVNIGKFRGNFPANQAEEAWQWLRQGIEEICEHAATKGISVSLEPQNKNNLNNINTTQEGLAWIKKMGISNLFLMLDTYHMAAEDDSLLEGLLEAKDYINHMHIADSERGIPGQGSINIGEIIKTLKDFGYSGYLSVEIAQKPDSLTAARMSWEYLDAIRRDS